MRASWTGYISCGLINIPIKCYRATEDRSVKFHQLHAADHGRIRQKLACEECGEIVERHDICRGFEIEPARQAVLTDEEIDRGLAGVKGIEIIRFVETTTVDPAYIDGTYFIGPDDTSSSKRRMPPAPGTLASYRLLVAAMAAEGLDALCRVTVRERQRMAILRIKAGPRGDVLALDYLRWSDEVRAADVDYADLLAGIALPPEQLAMARRLVANMKGEADLAAFRDEYRDRVLALIEAKVSGEEAPAEEETPTAKVVDLMAALQASLEATERKEAV